MNQLPLLSIILPTRNRSTVVKNAIESVINQTFSDWELIIIDNDTTSATAEVVQSYLNEKIKYIRTGNLAMHDNWQVGADNAQGTYITVLEDKAAYAANAFEHVNNLIQHTEDPQIIVMGYINEDKEQVLPPAKDNPRIFSFSTTEVTQLFLNENQNQINAILPKMIFSWCHRSVVDWCKEKNEPFFHAMAPDYTSMSIQLSYFSRIFYIEAPLISFNSHYSVGRAYTQQEHNDPALKDFLQLSANNSLANCFKYSKIPQLYTTYNCNISG